jgi:hypothetical protein
LQEDVQEQAATELVTLVVMDDKTANVNPARLEAVMQNNRMLLDLNGSQGRAHNLKQQN